jgi:PAS domain S-box-containing protein
MAGKFLIVDEDESTRAIVAAVARAAKIEPVLAGSIAEARTQLAGFSPDLALIADTLPDGPGAALIASLKETHPETEPIVLVSGTRPERVVEAMREGAADFLAKPFSPKQLALVLGRVMKARSRRRSPTESHAAGTALIVDDEPLTLRILGNFLAEVGFAVFQARNLTEARASLEARLPEVVVSDIFLEAESGIDFLRETKHRWPYLPVVVVTSSTQSSILLEAIKAEAHTVLIKPLDKGEFQRVVQGARRLKWALEDRSRLQRAVDGFGAGLGFLEEMLDRIPPGETSPAATAPGRSADTFASLPSGLVLFDRDRKIMDLNPAACRLLALGRDRLIGLALEEVPQLARFQEAALQTLATGQTFTNLEATILVNGVERVFGYNSAPLVSPAHDGGALVYFQDITAKKRVEAHLRQTERLAAVGMLATGVTTEISTPLNVALGHTEMLMRAVGDPERLARHVEKIQESMRQAADFTSRLMKVVKTPESGEAKPTDLNLALTEVVQLLDRKLRLRSQQIELALDAQAAEVMGDPIELQQVFLNLLGAASDRSPGGGTLKLATANLTGVVEIAIQDASLALLASGPVNPSSKADGAVVPLVGMALARNIVQRFGGVIRTDDLPGTGTTITVRFPVASAKHRNRWMLPKNPRVRVATLSGRPAVLLADPGETADQIKTWLEEAGQPVEVRSSAQTALAPLESGPPALFLVDGAMTGTDWMGFLRLAAERRIAPVVLLLRDEGQRALLAGMGAAAPARMVSPPFATDALLQAVALAELERDQSALG